MEENLKEYLGIPRKFIPWFPEVDPAKCNGCRICVDACKHSVFSYDEKANKSVVNNPYFCEVYCQSCQFQCDQGAISFPDKIRIKDLIKELRKQYPPK